MEQTITDVVSASVTYIGTAPIGLLTTEEGWTIQKKSTSGGVVTYDFPVGAGGHPTDDGQFIWAERAQYVYGGAKDTTAPTLSTVTIASNNSDTAVGKPGDIVTLTIVASEQIKTPVVKIAGNTATVTLGIDHKHWTAAYTLALTDNEGVVPFVILFEDLAGNVGTPVKVTTDMGVVTYDRQLPLLTTVTIVSDNANTALAKTGDTITITIVANDNLTSKPEFEIAGHAIDAGDVTQGVDAAHWTAVYDMAGGDTAGVVPFTINFTDTEGNAGVEVTTTTNASTVTFDKTAPTGALDYSTNGGSSWASTVTVKDSATLRIRATFSEPLLDSPVVKLEIDNAILAATNMTKTSTTVYYYDLNVPAGDVATATCALSIGTDASGNVVTAAPTANATFTVDNTAVTATLLYSKNAGVDYATTISVKDADTLRIKATFSEPLLDSPVVKIAIDNGILAATAMTKVSTTEYRYDLNVPVGDIATATCTMSVGTDAAGNVVTAAPTNATFKVDNTVPTMSSAARDSDTQLTLTLSELALATTTTKANDGGFVVHETGAPGTTYAVSGIAPGVTDDLVVLTVANMGASNVAGVTVKYTAAGNGTVTDVAGNALATNAVGVVVAPW